MLGKICLSSAYTRFTCLCSDHHALNGYLYPTGAFGVCEKNPGAGQVRIDILCARGSGVRCTLKPDHRGTLLERAPPLRASASSPVHGLPPGAPHNPASTSPLGSPRSSNSSDSGTDLDSTGSTINLGMGQVETTNLKAVNIAALNGCVGIFLFGNSNSTHGFTTGAHADPDKLKKMSNRAADQARRFGPVSLFVIIAHEDLWALQVGRRLRSYFPNVENRVIKYPSGEFFGDHEYKATYRVANSAPIIERSYTPVTSLTTWGPLQGWEEIDLSAGANNSWERILRLVMRGGRLELERV